MELAAVLAIDGGNSKTDLALVAADGTLLAGLRGPGANQEAHGIDGAMQILGGLVRDMASSAGVPGDGPVARHTSACLAGCDLPSEEADLTAALGGQGWSVTAVAMNDTFAVLRAGLPDDAPGAGGVAVTCGAGINCVAVAPDGRTARYLAIGAMSGDWGGGWGLSQAVIWHAMRAADGRGPATALGDAVAARFRLPAISDVVVAAHQGRLSADDLLALVPVLLATARAGDAVARSLVERQAREVREMVVAAMRRIALPSEGTTIVLGGGLLQAGDPLLDAAVEGELAAHAPGAIVRVAPVPPIAGAALLGLDHLNGLDRASPATSQRRHQAAAQRLRACFPIASGGTGVAPPEDTL